MAAVLLKIQYVNDMKAALGTPSVTDLVCQWVKPRSAAKGYIRPLIDSLEMFSVAELG